VGCMTILKWERDLFD